MNKGFTVLSVADKPIDEFTLQWLRERVDEHDPNIIEMSGKQADILHPLRKDKAPLKFRAIPIRIVETSFFGSKL